MTAAPPAVWNRVEAILAQGHPAAVTLTGGGSVAASWLLNHPGASRCLVDVRIPYHEGALAEELDGPGPHRVAEETARRLALRAWQRACRHGGADGIGLGATAALATARVRRGEDRAFAVARAARDYHYLRLDFDKDWGDTQEESPRLAQERLLSTALVRLLARACGAEDARACGAEDEGDDGGRDGDALPPWARVAWERSAVEPGIEDLLERRIDAAEMAGAGGATVPTVRPDRLLIPGSFNPLHAGHAGLADAAARRSGRVADFELSVANVDKPALPYREILRRAAQDRDGRRLLLTREPTFVGKARIFPGCWFAIGYDTAVRLVEPAYYDGSRATRDAALDELRELGCRFLVAGRRWQGRYRRLADVDVPSGYADLLEEIPESQFRNDVSSSALREGG